MRKKTKKSTISKNLTLQLDRSKTAELMKKSVERKASMVVIGGIDVGRTIPLSSDEPVVIGRNPNCSVVVSDDGVSWEHAEVRCEGGERYVIRDLKSTNGVFVQGHQVETHRLEEGDKVILGRQMILKFVLQDKWDMQYQKQIYESSVRDPLTGIFNRKHFEERILSELSFTRRYHEPLSLLMLDFDHFKQVNDNYGHQVGDQVLVMASEVLSFSLREEDFFARYGGEEFIVIARGTDQEGASILGERLRKHVEEMKMLTSDSELIPVTVSVGIVTVNGGVDVKADNLVKEADKNLYRAKEGGRNLVVASEIKMSSSPKSGVTGKGSKRHS